jgi:16S rRNA U516 pseudouridylate synthase RsuA-like enzyme
LYNKFTELIDNSADKFLEVVLDVYFTENLGTGIYKNIRLDIDIFGNLTITNNGQVEINTVIDKEYPRQFNYIAFLDKLSEYMEKNEVIYSPF